MDGSLPSDSSYHGTQEAGKKFSQDRTDLSGRWYFSRKEIEENSPSQLDGIDLKKETYLRKSYCTFLQDLGMRLKVPQVTIATAIIFCHRFFLRHSHAKNERRTIATVCMFLAGKVEETPRPLKDVIMVSYEIIHKKDPVASQRIKQKEVYEQQKELILIGERIVLATLGFDLNVHHPYKPLVEAIKKFKVAQNALAQVAWNFVNDGLRTSLCLQFKPHHIAAGAIFLAAKFLKVKLPSDGDKVWWQEFDVTPRQLEEVSNQMLELYEQNRIPPTQGSELEGTVVHRAPSSKPSSANEDNASNSFHQGGGPNSVSWTDAHAVQIQSNGPLGHGSDANPKYEEKPEVKPSFYQDDSGGTEKPGEDRYIGTVGLGQSQSPQAAIKMIDKDKLKAAVKQRKMRGDLARKKDLMDDDDLIEKELEDGIELGVAHHQGMRDSEKMEEGEVSDGSRSPRGERKRKAVGSPPRERSGYQDAGMGWPGYGERDRKNYVQENQIQ